MYPGASRNIGGFLWCRSLHEWLATGEHPGALYMRRNVFLTPHSYVMTQRKHHIAAHAELEEFAVGSTSASYSLPSSSDEEESRTCVSLEHAHVPPQYMCVVRYS